MLTENGVDNALLRSEPIKRRKRYKKFRTSTDFFTKGFEDLVSSDDSTDQYSTVFRRHQHQGREFIPTRVMTEVESRSKHPDVPHHWLCSGKLLVLEDPTHSGNLRLFQVCILLFSALLFTQLYSEKGPNLTLNYTMSHYLCRKTGFEGSQ